MARGGYDSPFVGFSRLTVSNLLACEKRRQYPPSIPAALRAGMGKRLNKLVLDFALLTSQIARAGAPILK